MCSCRRDHFLKLSPPSWALANRELWGNLFGAWCWQHDPYSSEVAAPAALEAGVVFDSHPRCLYICKCNRSNQSFNINYFCRFSSTGTKLLMYLPMKGRIYPEGYPDHFCLGASLFPVIVVASKGPAGQFAKTLRNKGQPRKELPSKAFKDSTQLEETISSEL